MVEISIKGESKEIAALVLELQERPENQITEYLDSNTIIRHLQGLLNQDPPTAEKKLKDAWDRIKQRNSCTTKDSTV